ncbi:MAG TPA: 5-formyltetrahydrofolate cyclo-ligase [Acidimicrobiales bacterium]|nr:5-formyltetrahydrofolate cyclo-ligase [Acidimicrobiales bacterium]
MPADHHGFIPASAEEALRRRVKGELRKRMRGLRNALPQAACAQRSQRIVARLAELEPVVLARAVALFWPIENRHEVDLRQLDDLLRARGVPVAYPVIDPGLHAMEFRFVADRDAMTPHPFGHREPRSGDVPALPGQLDVIVVPALAVDPRGHRIGYGAGHYDRALPAHVPPATSVAVAFDFQLVAEAPQTEGDVPVGWVVTDTRTIACASVS